MRRVVLHCDLNNFYASCECVCNPALKGLPVVVCGDTDLRHGIVLAKSQVAKSYGVKTGDVLWQAKQKCGNLISVNADFEKYLRFSFLVRQIYSEFTDYIESFGIDECWLDITKNVKDFSQAHDVAVKIKERIKSELGLTISVGISFNKIFAKLGSDLAGVDEIVQIPYENFESIVYPLSVENLLYVGKATKSKLYKIGIDTIGKLVAIGEKNLIERFGKWGKYLYDFASGNDTSEVKKVGIDSLVKSVGNSCTTPKDLTNKTEVLLVLNNLCESVASRMRDYCLVGKVVSISIRDKNLMWYQKQCTLNECTNCSSDILECAMQLFDQIYKNNNTPIRALGVSVAKVSKQEIVQIDMFGNFEKHQKKEKLERAVDVLRDRFGHDKVFKAMNLLCKNLVELNPKKEHTIHPMCFFR